MAMLDSDNTVPDGHGPFYTADSSNPPYIVKAVSNALAQGAGSSLDSDSVAGLQAVTSTNYGPNKLVATGTDSKLPLAIIPTSGGGLGVLSYVTGSYSSLVASPPSGPAFGIATDQGVAGALYFYWGNASAGDSGWTLIGGS